MDLWLSKKRNTSNFQWAGKKQTNLFTVSDFLAVLPIFETLVFWKAASLKENTSSNPPLLRRISFLGDLFVVKHPLQGTNISHLGKGKIIFKSALVGDMLLPRRVTHLLHLFTSPMPKDPQQRRLQLLNRWSFPMLSQVGFMTRV